MADIYSSICRVRRVRASAAVPISAAARSATSTINGHGGEVCCSEAGGVGIVLSGSGRGTGVAPAGVEDCVRDRGVELGVAVPGVDVGMALVGASVGVMTSNARGDVATCGVEAEVSFPCVDTGVGDITSGVVDCSTRGSEALLLSCKISSIGALIPRIGERPSPYGYFPKMAKVALIPGIGE